MLTDLHLENQYLIKLNADGFLLVWEWEDIVCLFGRDDLGWLQLGELLIL